MGQLTSQTPQNETAVETRVRLTEKVASHLAPLEEALRLPEAAALTALLALDRQHPGGIVYSQLQALWHMRLIDTNANEGLWKEALVHANEAIRLGSDDPQILATRAFLLWVNGDIDGYRASCQSMVDRFAFSESPELASVVAFAVGLQDGALDDYAGFLDQIRRSIGRVRSDDGPAYRFHLARVLARAGRYTEAVEEFEQVDRFLNAKGMRVNFNPVVYRFHLAICHARLGHADIARRWLDEAVADAEIYLKKAQHTDQNFWWFGTMLQRFKAEAESALKALKP